MVGVGIGTHLAMCIVAVVVVDGRGLRVEGCGCGCLFPTHVIGIIYFQQYICHLCPVSSAGYRVV
jgi:hypothetical protein